MSRIDVKGAGGMPHGCSHDANVMSQNLSGKLVCESCIQQQHIG
jgi:hypothetical protein